MKSSTLLLCTVGLLTVALPTSLLAGGDPDKKAQKKAVKAVLAQYDKNSNGIIDGDEVDAVKKAYISEPNGILKRFDTNSDGKLDDTEIAAIHVGKKGGKKKKKGSSTTVPAATPAPAPARRATPATHRIDDVRIGDCARPSVDAIVPNQTAFRAYIHAAAPVAGEQSKIPQSKIENPDAP